MSEYHYSVILEVEWQLLLTCLQLASSFFEIDWFGIKYCVMDALLECQNISDFIQMNFELE